MVEELAEEREPRVERRRQALVGRDVRQDQARRRPSRGRAARPTFCRMARIGLRLRRQSVRLDRGGDGAQDRAARSPSKPSGRAPSRPRPDWRATDRRSGSRWCGCSNRRRCIRLVRRRGVGSRLGSHALRRGPARSCPRTRLPAGTPGRADAGTAGRRRPSRSGPGSGCCSVPSTVRRPQLMLLAGIRPSAPNSGSPAACASAILICARMKSRSDRIYVTICSPSRRTKSLPVVTIRRCASAAHTDVRSGPGAWAAGRKVSGISRTLV